MDSTMCRKRSLQLSATCWHDRQLHIMLNLSIHNSEDVLLDQDLVTLEATELYWTHCHVCGTSLRWCVFCDMVHYPAGSIDEKLGRLWTTKTKIFPTPQPAWTSVTKHSGTMDSSCLLQIPILRCACCNRNPDMSHQDKFANRLLSIFSELFSQCDLRILFLAARSWTWCGQGLTCFMFRDAPFNSTVVRRSYFSCCCLPISLNVFVHRTVAHYMFSIFPTIPCTLSRLNNTVR